MPNTASAKKALRQNTRRRALNTKRKKTLRDTVKAYKKSPSGEGLALVYKKLDKAVKVKLMKKNTVARAKSRLSRLVAQSKK